MPIHSLPEHQVQYWSHTAESGPEMAEIRYYGPEEELHTLTRRLGDKVMIRCANGQEVWWGYVSGAVIPCGAFTQSYSLNEPLVCNSVRVRYTPPGEDADGNPFPEAITDEAINVDSQNSYWKKECIIDAGNATLAQAEKKRDQYLRDHAFPTAQVEQGSNRSDCVATLIMRGPKHQLADCLLYTDLSQFDAQDPDDPESEPLPHELPIADILASIEAKLGAGHLPCIKGIEIKAELPAISIAVADYRNFEEYIREIISLGDANENPLVCKVTPGGLLQICPRPTVAERAFNVDREQQISDSFGTCLDKSCVNLACAWILNACGPNYTSAAVRNNGAIFVKSYEFQPTSGNGSFSLRNEG